MAALKLARLWGTMRFALALGAAATAFGVPTGAMAQGRHASMVIDANTGQVLHQQSADEIRFPASLTKMMTLYLAFELMEQGRLTPSTRIPISDEAAGTPPSKLGLKPGSEIALIDALKIISVKSANDIAVAVAELIAGREDKFAVLMTRKARQLGMANTTFKNAHGLPNAGQVTTARDMLTLAMRLQDDFPKHYGIFGLRAFTYGGVSYRNHNTMLSTYPGMDGLKTGYTTSSGFNLVASVRRNGRNVVAVVFGGSTASARNAHMRTILDRALPRAAPERSRLTVPVARLARPERHAERAAEAAPKLVDAPKRAARPAAVVAAAEPRPSPPAQPVAPPAAEPAPAAVADTPPVREVKVTKVRPLVLAPRPSPERTSPAAEARPAPAPAPLSLPPQPAAVAELGPSNPAVEAAPAAQPDAPAAAAEDRGLDAPGRRLAGFRAPAGLTASRPAAPPEQPAAPARNEMAAMPPALATPEQAPQTTPRATPERPPQPALRGTAPSSLQAQARRLERGEQAVVPAGAAAREEPRPLEPRRMAAAGAAPMLHLNGPATAPTPAPDAAASVVIQIGAFASEAEARRQLASARERAGSMLETASPVTQPVQVSGRSLFRARFTGLSPGAAASTCTELRRGGIDCLVAPAN